MAKLKLNNVYQKKVSTKRPGVHSKNASKGQVKFKKKYKGQGRR